MRSVLMYSGGLDAYAVDKLCEPDKKVFVQMGTDESREESALIAINGDDVETVQAEFISQFERDNKVIPYRNALLALIGAQYGNEVMLGATAGDGIDTSDTTTAWAATVTAMLRQHVESGRPQETAPKVSLPVKSYSKAELVERLIREKNLNLETIIDETKSCHYGDVDMGCGECFGCVRRFVAFVHNSAEAVGLSHRLPIDEIEQWFHGDIVGYIQENEEDLAERYEGRGKAKLNFAEALTELGLRYESLSLEEYK